MKNQSKFTNQKTVCKMQRWLFITCIILAGVVLACLLAVAGLFDYKIDNALASKFLPKLANTSINEADGTLTNLIGSVYTTSIFGQIIEIIGTAPCIVVTLCALGIFYWNASKIKKTGLKVFTKISMVVLSLFWTMYSCFFQFFPLFIISVVGVQEYANYAPMSHSNVMFLFLVFGLLIGLIFTYATFGLLRKVNPTTMAELLRWAFIVSSASLLSILVVEIAIKPVFQRERFRFIYAFNQVTSLTLKDGRVLTGIDVQNYLNDINVYGGFHDWYKIPVSPHAFKQGNFPFLSEDITKSFPSGHETMAAIGFLSLIILPFTVRQCNTLRTKLICFISAFAGTIIVALGRMVAGAHYLSDTVFGCFIASACLYIFYLLNVRGSKFLDRLTGLQIVNRKKK